MSGPKAMAFIAALVVVFVLWSVSDSVAQQALVVKDGKVGINTDDPKAPLHVYGTGDVFGGFGVDPGGAGPGFNFGYGGGSLGESSGFLDVRPGNGPVGRNPALLFGTSNLTRMVIDNEGFVGLGQSLGDGATTGFDPAHPIHHQESGAHLSLAGVWENGSSRALKEDIEPLAAGEALLAFTGLEPVSYVYKANGEKRVGFIAEDVPELVASPGRSTLSSLNLVAVLTKVVQEQQKRIGELESRLDGNERLLERIARLEDKVEAGNH